MKEGKFKGTTVIKPCEDDYEIVRLRTSILESSFFPIEYGLDCPFRLQNAFSQGQMFEEIIQSSCMDPLAGQQYAEEVLERLKDRTDLYDNDEEYSLGDDKSFEYFLYKLNKGHFVEIAKKFYEGKTLAVGMKLVRFIECGKYLVKFTGEADMLDTDGNLRDLKLYKSFGDRKGEDRDIYTLDNREGSTLQKKLQRFMYPWLLGRGNKDFYYDVYPKTKNKPSKNYPNRHLKRDVYHCHVDIKKAEKEAKRLIVKYFMLCNETGTTPGNVIQYEE